MNAPTIDNDLRVAVTGAGGFLGQNLCRHLRDSGATVFELTSRSGNNDRPSQGTRFTLQTGVAEDFFTEQKINSLVHAAYDFNPRTRAAIWESNVRGSINLFAQARAEGVQRIVFISSMSAYDGCRSLYGQAKLEIENALSPMTGAGCSIRPGLIYSTPLSDSGGMVGSILNSLERGLTPLIGNGQQQLYFSYVNDLDRLINLLLQDSQPMPSSAITAANPRPYALREIIELLAQAKNASRPRFVPVPWRVAWAGVRTLESAGVKTQFRSDSILSLVHQNPNPDFSTVPDGINFRDFAAAIGAISD